jgi:hypothetical protein
MDTPKSFTWIIILFDEVFKYGDGAKFWGYVGTNGEALYVEFCNVLVNYLAFCMCAPINNFWTKWFKFVTASLYVVRKVGRAVLCRTSCLINQLQTLRWTKLSEVTHILSNLIICKIFLWFSQLSNCTTYYILSHGQKSSGLPAFVLTALPARRRIHSSCTIYCQLSILLPTFSYLRRHETAHLATCTDTAIYP